jgi:hypothetical protein
MPQGVICRRDVAAGENVTAAFPGSCGLEVNAVKSLTMTSITRNFAAVRFAALGLLLLFGFTAVYTAAFHNPEPAELRVAVVGPASALREVRATLDPQQFRAVRYPTEAAARRALGQDEIHGAYVDGRILIASASGSVAAQKTELALTTIAPQATVEDVAPLPPHDARGISAFVTVVGTTIASMVFAVLLTLFGGHHPLRARVVALLTVSGLGGVAVALSVDSVVGALAGDFWGVAGVAALLILAVTVAVHGLGRLLGAAGAALAALVVILVGVTSSGGAVGYELQPAFFRAVSQLMPPGAALTAVRNAVYLGGAHTVGPLVVLAAWATAGAAALALGHHRGPLFA